MGIRDSHYDVRPVDPTDEWITPPYSADIRDGVIYARGVADNKDGLVTRLCAVDAWQKAVSYTHLDVYKRQQKNRAARAKAAPDGGSLHSCVQCKNKTSAFPGYRAEYSKCM